MTKKMIAANEPFHRPFTPAPRLAVIDGDTGEELTYYDGRACDPALLVHAIDGDTGEPVVMLRAAPLARAA